MKDLYITVIAAVAVFFLCRWIYLSTQDREINLFDNKKSVSIFLKVFYILLALLLGADFFIHKHDHVELGNAPEFYAVYGFISCVVLFYIAKVLSFLVKRDETYYD